MDERRRGGRAIREGLSVVGCIGILEELYRRGDLTDLREIYRELLAQTIRVEQRILQASLHHLGLMPL
jgi:predicted nucleic acid-binding protein